MARHPQTIVLPEGNDKRVVTAAGMLARRELCRVIVLGNKQAVLELAAQLQVDISRCTIIDPTQADDHAEMATALYECRKAKGMTPEKAKDLVQVSWSMASAACFRSGAC